MSTLTTCLWLDGQAEAAYHFYLSVFPQATGGRMYRPTPEGPVLTAELTLQGQPFMLLNGGPMYQLTPATSFIIHCANQAEVDHFWAHLAEGGQPMACGWVTDRFGVTWQVVPTRLLELLMGPDTARAARVHQQMLTMQKLDIAPLENA